MTQTTKSKRARKSQERSNNVPTSDARRDDNVYALRVIPITSHGLHTRRSIWCDGQCNYAGRSGKHKATMKRGATKELNILGYILGVYCDKCTKVMKEAYENAANNWEPQEGT